MQARDLYVVIGVPFNASSQDIRAAYLRKSLETHPDKGGDEVLFRDVCPLPSLGLALEQHGADNTEFLPTLLLVWLAVG